MLNLNRSDVSLDSPLLTTPDPLSREGVSFNDPSSVVPLSNMLKFLPIAFEAIHSSFSGSHLILTFSLLRVGNNPAPSFSILKVDAWVSIESGKNLNSSDFAVDVRCFREPLPISPLLLMLKLSYNLPFVPYTSIPSWGTFILNPSELFSCIVRYCRMGFRIFPA